MGGAPPIPRGHQECVGQRQGRNRGEFAHRCPERESPTPEPHLSLVTGTYFPGLTPPRLRADDRDPRLQDRRNRVDGGEGGEGDGGAHALKAGLDVD